MTVSAYFSAKEIFARLLHVMMNDHRRMVNYVVMNCVVFVDMRHRCHDNSNMAK